MSDLISRKAAIDALDKRFDSIPMEQTTEILLLRKDLRELPSAQPEKRTNERTETHACDLIERQAAIDAILAVTGNTSVRELYEHVQEHGLSDMWSGGVNAAIDIIIAVPSAQPEVLACGEGELIAQPEIVRCKDCKYWNDEFAKDKSTCWLPCMSTTTHREWHCGSAERRTDETD